MKSVYYIYSARGSQEPEVKAIVRCKAHLPGAVAAVRFQEFDWDDPETVVFWREKSVDEYNLDGSRRTIKLFRQQPT